MIGMAGMANMSGYPMNQKAMHGHKDKPYSGSPNETYGNVPNQNFGYSQNYNQANIGNSPNYN